ncbi:YdcF family protein [Candidatus Saccharibacteria bacterium]|nr:YdcF family protein [Candidatus Saccharibacteria bacterium]
MTNNKSPKTLSIVLGRKLDKSGNMTIGLVQMLDSAIKNYKNNPSMNILVCGKYSIEYDWQGFSPNHYESKEMKKYLVRKGIPEYKIATEQNSKDTIGNIYYAKQYVKRHPSFSIIVVFCTEIHRQRVEFIFNKFFGSNYKINYKTIDSQPSAIDVNSEEKELQYITSDHSIIKNIQDGNDTDFKYNLYRNKFYRR